MVWPSPEKLPLDSLPQQLPIVKTRGRYRWCMHERSGVRAFEVVVVEDSSAQPPHTERGYLVGLYLYAEGEECLSLPL